jgi:L-2,4-diaminobutyrate decarboxylase
MNAELEQLLDRIEADMSPDAAAPFAAIAAGYLSRTRRGDGPVSTRLTPSELAARFAGGFPEDGSPLEDVLLRVANDVVAESNWLYHPRYMGHQVSAPLPAAVWTEQVISALNNSVAVQEMSPAVTMLEEQLIRWMAGLAGYGQDAGGTFTSGGTEATFTALLAARARALPDAWENGVEGAMPVVLCGEHAHYATTRAVAQLGLGLKRAVAVRSKDFRMDVADLEARIGQLKAEGIPVMAVVATAGSTPTGAFDDLERIGELCNSQGIWLHVDGAHGASALLSATQRARVAGIDRADSIAWDPHKMMLMPLAAGVLLVRDEAALERAFSQRAPYLFQQTGAGRSHDQASRSFLCSRRSDALKVWVALHRYGTRAFGLLYDYFCDLTRELHDVLAAHPAFETLHEPSCNILCFRHGGTDELNARLRAEYNARGTGWITSTLLDGRRVLRVTLINPRIRSGHLRDMVTELAETAARL